MGNETVVVHVPDESGGRRVQVGSEVLGLAHGLRDVAEFLRRDAPDWDEERVAASPLIDWRGGGPDTWPAPWGMDEV
ncbi:hypothetical protein [Streptomyces subrutilus]|uniref:hypothetical protein n=1 Tax=Streptomyces subrutilus TaxID=36818 RepID=UPI002E148F78|nr:hypothetical protein OG479_03295 [Streptomyces subrutilus]